MKRIGKVTELYRYPVKSFQGEALDMLEVNQFGITGDRYHVFIDHSRSNKHLSAKQVPELLGYTANYTDNSLKEIQVATPQGATHSWDSTLLKEIKELSKRELSQHTFTHEDGLKAVDVEHILITSKQAMLAIQNIYGDQIDYRRFRPNIVIDIKDYDQGSEFPEFELVGQSIQIGHVVLEITEKCERCSMVNVDPDNLTSNPTLLKELYERLDGCFGVYAKVKRFGNVHLADEVLLF